MIAQKQKTASHKTKRSRQMTAAALLMLTLTAETVLTGMTEPGASDTAEILVDGGTRTIRASGEAISAVLARENILLGEYDEINHSPEERVTAGMRIVIDRVEYIEKTTSEPVPYETVYMNSTLDRIGTSRVKTQGSSGRTDTTVVEKLVNGETAGVSVSNIREIPPINEVIAVGTALNKPYSGKEGSFTLENGIPSEYAYRLSGKVTAYTAPEGAGTYSGRALEIGTAAVDPEKIPFGSELYICSKDGSQVYGYAIAADTGSLTDVIADVYMGTTDEHFDEACRWGAQDAYVYVLSVGDNSVSWQ